MKDKVSLESVLLHLIRPQDLNHHGTMFAAQLAKWVIEAGLLTACNLVGKPEDVVCVQVDRLTFKKPLNNGDLIEIKSRVAYLGSSSITIYSEVLKTQDIVPTVSNMTTFVTVDKKNRPYVHGFKLSKEYIAKNRDIYKAASKIQEQNSLTPKEDVQ